MHKFIHPVSDSYIDSHPDYRSKNFGRDEILEISSDTYSIRGFVSTSSLQTTDTTYEGLDLISFAGSVTGSLTGSGYVVFGQIIYTGSSMNR